MRGEMILMLGCVNMAYLDVPSRDSSRNVEEASATEALTFLSAPHTQNAQSY